MAIEAGENPLSQNAIRGGLGRLYEMALSDWSVSLPPLITECLRRQPGSHAAQLFADASSCVVWRKQTRSSCCKPRFAVERDLPHEAIAVLVVVDLGGCTRVSQSMEDALKVVLKHAPGAKLVFEPAKLSKGGAKTSEWAADVAEVGLSCHLFQDMCSTEVGEAKRSRRPPPLVWTFA